MNKFSKLKVALVYDRINKWGGAERLILALGKLFPKADLYTLVYHQPTSSWAKGFKIIPSFFNHFTWLRSHHELLAPFSPVGFESFDFGGYDLVISITSESGKAIITKPDTLHLCYCLTPTRYLWSAKDDYQATPSLGLFSRLAAYILHKYTNWFQKRDFILSQRPDHYISISKEIQTRIRRYYKRDSDIIYPPIDYAFWSKVSRSNSNQVLPYYLVVSRLVPYKKVDLVISTFAQSGFAKLNLKVVGIGSHLNQLKSLATANVQFLGQVSDSQLRDLYAHATAVIFPQIEDLGLVPLEAQATGTPVIAYRKGGALETIIPGKTGIFFDHQTVSSLTQAIKLFTKTHTQFTSNLCRHNAKQFAETRFLKHFSDKVDALL